MLQHNFVGLSLKSASKQLKIDTAVLIKDVQSGIASLIQYNLINTLKMVFKNSNINTISNDENDKIQLYHIFALVVTYRRKITLNHISALIQSPDDNKENGNNDNIDNIDVISLFENQLQSSAQQNILSPFLQQCSKQKAISFYYGNTDGDTDASTYPSFISIKNHQIYKECIEQRNKFKLGLTLLPANKPSKAIPKIKKTMKFPKKLLPKYHNKKYHRFGSRHLLPIYSQDEVSQHNTRDSCWIIVNGLVLDATNFLLYHPGSAESILKNGGNDCSQQFKFHSSSAQKLWMKFVIGTIEKNNINNNCLIQ